jgi:hypothetical protein
MKAVGDMLIDREKSGMMWYYQLYLMELETRPSREGAEKARVAKI